MEPYDRDDLIHCLNEASEFYGKTLNQTQVKIWIRTLDGFKAQDIRNAFDEYFLTGKYMPKPADIKELIDNAKINRSARYQKPEKQEYTPPPAEIQAAWAIYIQEFQGFVLPGHLQRHADMDREHALHIVNRHAARLNMPSAVNPEHRLAEYWGNKAA